MFFSPHFTITELSSTQTGLKNEPTVDAITELQRLCKDVLEPVRLVLGVPMAINSGYRSPEVNQAIGGAVTSQHMRGQAVDFVPLGMDLEEAFQMIKASKVIYDQLILEPSWIHISVEPLGQKPRMQTLKCVFKNGKPVYSAY